MVFQSNFDLSSYNSFGIRSMSQWYCTCSDLVTLEAALDFCNQKPKLILGGGSNVLLPETLSGLVIKNDFKGIEIIKEDDNYVFIKAGGGEVWHSFVMHTVNNGWGGLENLSLIPGSVGASPIQNIGAYGVEIKDHLVEVHAWDILEKKVVCFQNQDCAFGYRESIFKSRYKGRFFILSVVFKLHKHPVLQTSYGAILQELEKMHVNHPTIKDVSNAVIAIRQSKLPDPAIIGNAGSFFKNPEIEISQYNVLKELYPEIPGYPLANGNIKLAAGWLIEKAGWKGYREGEVGCHKNQALVLVNYGQGNQKDVLNLANKIAASVQQMFQVTITPEVNIIE